MTITAVDDQLVEGPESFPGVTLAAPTSNATVSTAGSGTVNVTENDTATVTLSGTTKATEGGATGSQTVTLTLNTSGTGSPSLATAINGITLASNADYSSDTQSFGVGAVSGTTTTLTVTATDDQLVEGTENGLSSSLAPPQHRLGQHRRQRHGERDR